MTIALVPEKEADVLYENLRFFMHTPISRRDQIAKLLGIPSVYCLAYDSNGDVRPLKKGDRVYLQTREKHSSGKLMLYEVIEHVAEITDLIVRPWSETDQNEVKREDAVNMSLARRELL